MEGYNNNFKWLVALALLALVVPQWTTAQIQCNEAVTRVLPCEGYLMSGDSAPNVQCCSAVQSLDKIAVTSRPDRRAICQCFKDTARSFPVNFAKAQQLPKLCRVTLSVAITPDVDCNSI